MWEIMRVPINSVTFQNQPGRKRNIRDAKVKLVSRLAGLGGGRRADMLTEHLRFN